MENVGLMWVTLLTILRGDTLCQFIGGGCDAAVYMESSYMFMHIHTTASTLFQNMLMNNLYSLFWPLLSLFWQ